jgi:hypothetical protein
MVHMMLIKCLPCHRIFSRQIFHYFNDIPLFNIIRRKRKMLLPYLFKHMSKEIIYPQFENFQFETILLKVYFCYIQLNLYRTEDLQRTE